MNTNEKKAVRIGYVGSEGLHGWKGKYKSLDGVMKRNISPKNKGLDVNVETVSGCLTVEAYSKENEKLFGQRFEESGSAFIDVGGKVIIKIIGESHSGSFEIL